ncbi:MAG TPA: hypothetical protein VJT32_01080, partial [bacterium]|nr:hypothetical protein [bacterium]
MGRGRLHLVLRHPGAGGLGHRQGRRRAEVAGPADPLKFGRTLRHQELVEEVTDRLHPRLRQGLGQRTVLVDRHVIPVPRVDDRQADPPRFQAQLADPLDQHLGKLAAAGRAHIADGDRAPRRLDVGAPHPVEQRGLAFARDEQVQR